LQHPGTDVKPLFRIFLLRFGTTQPMAVPKLVLDLEAEPLVPSATSAADQRFERRRRAQFDVMPEQGARQREQSTNHDSSSSSALSSSSSSLTIRWYSSISASRTRIVCSMSMI